MSHATHPSSAVNPQFHARNTPYISRVAEAVTPHIHQHQQTGIITGMCYLKLIALAAQCQCQLLLVLHSRPQGREGGGVSRTHLHTLGENYHLGLARTAAAKRKTSAC